GLSFQCTQCGNCCTGPPGYVWVSEIEIDRFAAHLRIDRETFVKKYCRSIGGEISLKERRSPKGEYDCVFLQEIKSRDGDKVTSRRVCSVYDVRPLQCRTWPFWDGLLESREAWESAKDRCPGIDRGRKYTLERIEQLRTAPDWPDAPPGSK
ncbi:MAG TPA: YkgJ family cysteine cluster protein, partial [Tepidisphaeraceae bacterium]